MPTATCSARPLPGGANGDGTVFEIAKTATGYASTPTTLVSFDGADGSSPIGRPDRRRQRRPVRHDEGGGANGDGTVFEIAKTAGGYASTPTTLVSFDGTNGAQPCGGLIADANGDLFGTTSEGGAQRDGTVFEIAKTAGGYASTPTTLVSFNGTNGATPTAGLIADANGDLFGTTAAAVRTTTARCSRSPRPPPATPAPPPRWSASTAPTARIHWAA